MTPQQWSKIEEIFAAASERDATERVEFLDEACAGDGELRSEVDGLLASFDSAEQFIEAPAFAFASGLIDDSSTARAQTGRRIGPYQLIQEIDHGGMGAVYLATRADEQYEKQVAIKLIKHGLDNEDIRRRFRHERQILASLDHPNIARLIDGGTTDDGLPYLVMDYVEGSPITRYCDERNLPNEERLKLFRMICSAVQYAHQRLVIHRDIKPGNILVTKDGTPKLLDFGIAKLLDPSESDFESHTVTQLGVMTPEYASPEQIKGEPVTTASDVYSLGVLLYELLTGQRPFRITTRRPDEIARVICEQEPEKPSQVASSRSSVVSGNGQRAESEELSDPNANQKSTIKNPKSLKGDLDNIILMAMRKEPTRRYASVEQFSEDIRRHLEGLPVIARKDTYGYRAGKFIQRHRVGVAAAAVVVLALVGGVIATAWEARAARKQRDAAQVEQAKAERINAFLQDMLGAAAPEAKGTEVKVIDVLGEASKRARTDLASKPEVLADVLLTLGRTYVSLGHYDSAESDLRTALDASLKANGEMHATTAAALSWLGLALAYENKTNEGDPISHRAVDLWRKLRPEGNQELGVALYSLGANLINKGDSKSAIPFLQEAEVLLKTHLGETHGYHVASLGMLGLAYAQSGDAAKAEATYRNAIEIGRRVEYRYRIFLAQSLGYLGILLTSKGNYAEADAVLRESISVYSEQAGDSNYSIAFDQINLAWLHFLQHKYGDAEKEYRDAYQMLLKLFSSKHLMTLRAEAGLGLTLTREGKAKEGETLLREALEIRKQVMAPEDLNIRMSESSLGECLTVERRYGEAEPLLISGYEGLKAKLGEQQQFTVEARQRLFKLYEAWGKPSEAERYK